MDGNVFLDSVLIQGLSFSTTEWTWPLKLRELSKIILISYKIFNQIF